MKTFKRTFTRTLVTLTYGSMVGIVFMGGIYFVADFLMFSPIYYRYFIIWIGMILFFTLCLTILIESDS